MVFDIAQRIAELLGFLDFEDFAILVVPALSADTMRHLLLVTVWTLRTCVRGKEVVRATDGGPAF